MSDPWGLLGVPSSAAAHWPGLEKAPAALRAAGITDRLRAASVPFTDFGDSPVVRWKSARQAGLPNNVPQVRAVLEDTRTRVAGILRSGHRPFIVGGECTLTVAVVAALVAQGTHVGLVYIDGGQDLMIPPDHPDEPILDGMGVAHLLNLPGTLDEITSIGMRRPLLEPSDVVFFGFSDEEEDTGGLVPSARFPAEQVAIDPESSAAAAADHLWPRRYVVHVDVDVLDFLQTPAADIPTYGRGLSMEDLSRALRRLVNDPRCVALVLVEYNPDHDPTGIAAAEILQAVAGSMSEQPEAYANGVR